MPYMNLKAEMARRNITIEALATLLDIHRNSVSNKLNGPSNFSIEQAFKIQSTYFRNLALDYLFETKE